MTAKADLVTSMKAHFKPRSNAHAAMTNVVDWLLTDNGMDAVRAARDEAVRAGRV